MIKTLIEPEKVLSLAYGDAEFTPLSLISRAEIAACGGRYLLPILGKKMMTALERGAYLELLDDFVAPTLAFYVRFAVDRKQSSLSEAKSMLRRARALALRLRDHLEANLEEYPEYSSSENILNKCRINGGFVQIL